MKLKISFTNGENVELTDIFFWYYLDGPLRLIVQPKKNASEEDTADHVEYPLMNIRKVAVFT